MDIAALLALSVRNQASDLHLSAGLPPILRIHGELRRLDQPAIDHAQLLAMLHAQLDEDGCRRLAEGAELDFSFTQDGLGRFRANVFQQARGVAAAIRRIPQEIPRLQDIGAPAVCAELAMRPHGLVLVTGSSGSGKSTTLAAMINHINEQRPVHVLSIEAPIEFVHPPRRALITQREPGRHTASFASALRAALREDPDVVVVGELRDAETIRLALTAAETGHLVLATLHTASAAKSMERIVDAFGAAEKDGARAMLAESLQAIVSQVLLPTRDGQARVAAYEVMLATPAIRNLIREGKSAQLYATMQASGGAGMLTLETSLGMLLREQRISIVAARAHARSPNFFPA